MQRAKNEKLKKQYVDKMLLFLNNKYSRMFKDKKITNEKLRKILKKCWEIKILKILITNPI